MKFTEFGLVPLLEEGLDSMGYLNATPIQEQAIPVILHEKDLIACAQTGTGKTASYLLPILNKIALRETNHVDTLILVPTRELALQIDQQIMGLSYFTGTTSITVYGGGGGMDYEQQKRAIQEGVNIIVATPGRLIAHMASGKLDFSKIRHLILDEADRMLDMGFYDDLIKIISYLPAKRQNLLFSATMPFKIRSLAKKILHDPVEINIALSKPSEGIKQQAYLVYDEQKMELIKTLLADPSFTSIIIFASKKEIVKRLTTELRKGGIAAEAFHSDLEQAQREDVMNRFKGKRLNVLVGTDVISRGIDVVGISLVINYDVPPDPEDYVHRVGRTARAATTGTAITFINVKDQIRFAKIEELIGAEIEKVPLPEGFTEGPLYDPKKRPPRKKSNVKKNFRKFSKN
ncbi:DEAD/DEAH box helicase [Sphingobacterium alkalisoli]|uniref:DEAD/DEAH box helicase n=1 Tax=Sphingobacterium alkalisoli TaxID=1874115 RepID=A0A4U0H1V1_9SPHI|nr:DEAD/DEAH box helicase [Sphingobacterium alkalisoli]TJY65555.1 DEAD/DEAH box helicase [Sphingobacterium alkalisoli]GGH19756.1 RNA helicase [Sphingobacterium alkalisoli]